jgi:hypothetical protein
MPTRRDRLGLYAILIGCMGIYFAIRFAVVAAWLQITAPPEAEPIVQFMPEPAGITLDVTTSAAFLLALALLAYWLGPIIIARGIERSARQVQEFDGS